MALLSELSVALGHIASTVVSGAAKAILANIVMLDELDDDEEAETSTDEPLYGPLGFYARPMPPVSDSNATPTSPAGRAEVLGMRVADRVLPFGYRDLRLNALVAPEEGEVGMVQYQGGFIALRANTDGDGTSICLYAPRNVGGVPSRASTIQIDSTDGNQSISLMHEVGQSITLTKDGDVMLISPLGTNWVQVGDSQGIVVSADKVAVAGAVMLGDKDPALGDEVMLSTQLLGWIGQVNTALGLLAGATGAVVPAIVAPVAVPVPATKVKAI